MPTYGYECKSCKYSFDVFQSMRDEPLKECPKCGRELRRLISGGTGVIFKGNGFYVTDKGTAGGKEGKTDDTSKPSPEKTGGNESTPCAGCAKADIGSCPKASGQ